MIKNVSVKLINGVGIKVFRIPIREDEINKLNIHQIYKLFTMKSVKEIWEHNDDNTKKIKLNLSNYKEVTNWDNVESSNVEKKEAVKEEPKQEVVKEEPKKETVEEVVKEEPEANNTVEFEGETFEEIVDDNYDPDMGVDPDKE